VNGCFSIVGLVSGNSVDTTPRQVASVPGYIKQAVATEKLTACLLMTGEVYCLTNHKTIKLG
jgi:hypothetical protein